MYPDRSVSTERKRDQILRIQANRNLSDRACSSSNARRQECMHPTYSGSIPGGGATLWGPITCKRVKDVKTQPNSMGPFGYALQTHSDLLRLRLRLWIWKLEYAYCQTFRVVRIVSRLVNELSRIRQPVARKELNGERSCVGV
jgi:hypothetical protein